MSIIQVAKDALLGKKVDEPGAGNALWRETVIAPLANAAKIMKLNKQAFAPKTPEEVGLARRRVAKRNRKRKIQKLSRKKNRR